MKKGQVVIDTNDIIGKRLGKLKVTSYLGHRYSITNGGPKMRHYYLCECDCSSIHIVQRGQVKNEIVHSCGCGRRKRHV